MLDPPELRRSARVTAHLYYLGDVAGQTFNPGGVANALVDPDRFVAASRARPENTLGRRVLFGMALGAGCTEKFRRVLGTGIHRRGPSEPSTGTARARLRALWARGLDLSPEAHLARLVYLDEQFHQSVVRVEGAGSAGVQMSALWSSVGNAGAPIGETLGEAVGAGQWLLAWAVGRRESLWADMQRDSVACGTLVGFGFALVSAGGVGILPWTSLQALRLALAALTGTAACVGGLGMAAVHGALVVVAPARTRPPRARGDVEAPLLGGSGGAAGIAADGAAPPAAAAAPASR